MAEGSPCPVCLHPRFETDDGVEICSRCGHERSDYKQGTATDVLKAWDSGLFTKTKLARAFGLSRREVAAIIRGDGDG